MRKIAAALAVAAALVVVPAAAAEAKPVRLYDAPASVQAAEFWEINSYWNSLNSCKIAGAVGLQQGRWVSWYCQWNSYAGRYALWVRLY